MNLDKICKVVHDVVKAYLDNCSKLRMFTWEDSPKYHKDSVKGVVSFLVDHPDCTCEEIHSEWCRFKNHEGWAYGERPNSIKMQHPWLIPIKELKPAEQRIPLIVKAVVAAAVVS